MIPASVESAIEDALTDEWQTEADIYRAADLHSVWSSTFRVCLEDLERAGRAERREASLPPALSMQGYRVEWRAAKPGSKRRTNE